LAGPIAGLTIRACATCPFGGGGGGGGIFLRAGGCRLLVGLFGLAAEEGLEQQDQASDQLCPDSAPLEVVRHLTQEAFGLLVGLWGVGLGLHAR
jgi:hypothetical protein